MGAIAPGIALVDDCSRRLRPLRRQESRVIAASIALLQQITAQPRCPADDATAASQPAAPAEPPDADAARTRARIFAELPFGAFEAG